MKDNLIILKVNKEELLEIQTALTCYLNLNRKDLLKVRDTLLSNSTIDVKLFEQMVEFQQNEKKILKTLNTVNVCERFKEEKIYEQ